MDKNELSKLPPEQLAEAILLMGHIIRRLDESSEYLDYWTQVGEWYETEEQARVDIKRRIQEKGVEAVRKLITENAIPNHEERE